MMETEIDESYLISTENTLDDFDCVLDMIDSKAYDKLLTGNDSQDYQLNEPESDTIFKKLETEEAIMAVYDQVLQDGSDNFPVLKRKSHFMYIHGFLNRRLPAPFAKLDASQPWICYWLMNSSCLIKAPFSARELNQASKVLPTFFNKQYGIGGGFGGGPNQLPHLAASYATVLSLALTKNQDLWHELDLVAIKQWLLYMKNPDGSFTMHEGGECDTRSVYCALSIASLLNILDEELTKNVSQWLLRCQTYEGGFSGYPGDEAHGGYTYCGLAALFILLSPEEILQSGLNIEALIKWTADRQYSFEGGFSGRTNKLVDGCYSHWIGGTATLLEILVNYKTDIEHFTPLFDRRKLQNYILCCCQDKSGLRDKPGCHADFYHTNYVLCGLSICQHIQQYDINKDGKKGKAYSYTPLEIADASVIDSKPVNSVAPLDAIFGLPYGYAEAMHDYFASRK